MATVLPFVLAPEDEKQLLSFLAPYRLTAYPERIPPGFRPIPVDADAAEALVEPAYYLADLQAAPLVTRPVRRGREKGAVEIDETQSPVIHYLRSVYDEDGELRSGRFWCELNLVGDGRRLAAFPDSFRRMLLALRDHLQTRLHRSDPAGWWVGPHAARLFKAGTVLREEGRKGGLIKPYK